MQFVHATSGAIVGDAAIDEHECKFIIIDSRDRQRELQSMQPGDHWSAIGATEVLEHSVANMWAMECASLSAAARPLSLQQRSLLTPVAISRILGIAQAAILAVNRTALLKAHTLGQFLDLLFGACERLDTANKAGLAVSAADLLMLPGPTTAYDAGERWIDTITLGMLGARGTGSTRRVGWLAYACAGRGTAATNGKGGTLELLLKRVKGLTKPAEIGTEMDDIAVAVTKIIVSKACPTALRVYRDVGAARRQAATDEVTNGTVNAVEANLFRERAAEVIGYWEVSERAVRGAVEATQVQRLIESLLTAAAISSPCSTSALDALEMRITNREPFLKRTRPPAPATRGRAQGTGAHAHARHRRAPREAPRAHLAPRHGRKAHRARPGHALAIPSSAHATAHARATCAHERARGGGPPRLTHRPCPPPAEAEIAALPPGKRVAKLAEKISGERTALDSTHSGPAAPPPPGGGPPDVGLSKARKAAALEAAREQEFMDISADAKACHTAGDMNGASRIMFCGRSKARPHAAPNVLAKKIMYGKVDPYDLGAEYGWLTELPPHTAQYLAHEVSARWVADGLGAMSDYAAMSLGEAWAALSGPGAEWGTRLNVVKHVLVPLVQATQGPCITAPPDEQRYLDPVHNQQVPQLVGALMEAIGEQRSGEGSIRRIMEQSNRFVGLYAGYEEEGKSDTLSLLRDQSALWCAVMSEGGKRLDDRRFGADFAAKALEPMVLSEELSAGRAQFASAKRAHVDTATRRKHRLGGSGNAQQQLAGCERLAEALASISLGKAPTRRQAEAPPGADAAKAAADAAKAATDTAKAAARKATDEAAARAKTAADQGRQLADWRSAGVALRERDQSLVFGEKPYDKAAIEAAVPGACPYHVVWRCRASDPSRTGCRTPGCTLSHQVVLPTGFRLRDFEREPRPNDGGGRGGKAAGGRTANGKGAGGRGGPFKRQRDK